jgi:hypothetical protein
MSHIVFFSYANQDLDPHLEDLFKDLCWEISLLSGCEDKECGLRDKSSLPVMEKWSTNIVGARQTSTVLVCISSPRYFNSGRGASGILHQQTFHLLYRSLAPSNRSRKRAGRLALS